MFKTHRSPFRHIAKIAIAIMFFIGISASGQIIYAQNKTHHVNLQNQGPDTKKSLRHSRDIKIIEKIMEGNPEAFIKKQTTEKNKKALEYYEWALALNPPYIYLISNYINLGDIYTILENYNKASEFYQLALELYETSDAEKQSEIETLCKKIITLAYKNTDNSSEYLNCSTNNSQTNRKKAITSLIILKFLFVGIIMTIADKIKKHLKKKSQQSK